MSSEVEGIFPLGANMSSEVEGIFPLGANMSSEVEGIFPLGANMSSDSIPPKLFWMSITQGLVCAHMHSMDSKDPVIYVLDR